jgi:LCP family protein required for cell wall assembly
MVASEWRADPQLSRHLTRGEADMMLGRGGEQPARFRVRPAGCHRRVRSLVLGGLAICVAVVMVGGALAAYAVYRTDLDSVKRINVSPDLRRTHRPPPDPSALNILLIGSDSRGGPNKSFGAEVAGQRSDTVMVVHISPGARRVLVLSFPRDSVVPILACAPEAGAPGQVAQPAGNVEQLNATFSYGGPGCLWKTLEQTTGIRINDFIELTFTGFENLINDIGGVSVCLPVAVNDPDSRLRLSAGRHHVWGAEALAFWRARYIGEGSDLQRIQRDQFLMASLLHGIQRSGLAHSPTKIFRVLENVVGGGDVTTDTQLSLSRLVSIADELRGLPPRAVQFIEVPTVPYAGDPLAWVQWAQPQTDSLFAAIGRNTSLPTVQRHPATAAPPGETVATVSPAQVTVTVLNGTTESGLATSTAASLTSLGFNVVGAPGDAYPQDYTNSVIEYPARSDLPAARTLARLINGVTLQRDPALAAGTIQLVLGSTFTALASAPSADAAASSSLPSSGALARQYGGITGNVSICDDDGAFNGPDGDS